jgi:UDP-N-acetylglucosamine enolpyruvyl transferase
MLNVSRNHNLALELMISNILLQMENPITNLKKLLEIYHEILALNQSKIDHRLKDKFDSWKENSTLKKVCSLLIK